ncbi:MAG: hypothetical protein JXQ84_01520 [Rhodospirillaceae bacterium]|nr:hypothetical protein [Rhodospirillaceae bacterium]
MNSIEREAHKASKRLDDILLEAQIAKQHLLSNQAANQAMADASGTLNAGSKRIAAALASMAEGSTQITAAAARLSFENARLKRSSRGMRASLERLNEAKTLLDRRAREARDVANIADRTEALIKQINGCMERGEPVQHLLDEGQILATAPRAETLRCAP